MAPIELMHAHRKESVWGRLQIFTGCLEQADIGRRGITKRANPDRPSDRRCSLPPLGSPARRPPFLPSASSARPPSNRRGSLPPPRRSRVISPCLCDDHAPRPGGDAFRQPDFPLALVAVDAWRMVERCFQKQKIRAKLAYRNRSSVEEHVHSHIGRVARLNGRDQYG
jgi:hypothetical protein